MCVRNTVDGGKPGRRFRVGVSVLILLPVWLSAAADSEALLPLAAALIHESGHLLAMKLCGVSARETALSIFGAEIRCSTEGVGLGRRLIVWYAGAAANLAAGAAALCLPWRTAKVFASASFLLAALNLLPIRTLDGGCALEALLERFCPAHAGRVMTVLSGLILFFLWVGAVKLLLVSDGSLTLFLFCAGLFAELGGWGHEKNAA